MCDVAPTRWRLLPFGINVLLVSSAQRVGRVSHKTQGFPFYQFIKQAKHTHGNRYTLNSNTFTTRSENIYKRSGARTPSNVREFKRLPSKRTAISTS